MASPSTDLCRSACRAVLLSCCPPVLLSCPPPAMKAASCSVTAPGPWALHAGPCTQCCQSVLSPSPSLPCGVAHHPRTAAEDLRLARPRVSWFLLHAQPLCHLPGADGASLRTQPPVTLSPSYARGPCGSGAAAPMARAMLGGRGGIQEGPETHGCSTQPTQPGWSPPLPPAPCSHAPAQGRL